MDRQIQMDNNTTPNQGQAQIIPSPIPNPDDLSGFVKSLLEQMQSSFQTMSETIVQKIDKMGNQIEDIEKSIQELTDLTAQPDVQDPSSLAPSNETNTSW